MSEHRTHGLSYTMAPLRRIPGKTGEGVLTIIEADKDIRFDVRRVFFATGMAQGTRRGGHAHVSLEQFLICLHGRMSVTLKTKTGEQHLTLSVDGEGVHVPPMTWVEYTAEDDDTICLVLASDVYDEADYCRDWDKFVRLCGR